MKARAVSRDGLYSSTPYACPVGPERAATVGLRCPWAWR